MMIFSGVSTVSVRANLEMGQTEISLMDSRETIYCRLARKKTSGLSWS